MAEAGVPDDADLKLLLDVSGVLPSNRIPDAWSDELGVHGELKFPSDKGVRDASGVPEHPDSLAEGLVASTTMI